MKKKTYVLTVSKVFMKGHPRAGQPTHFRQLILEGKKIHTIRAGDYWRKVAEEVNAGSAVLSIREWLGLPYNSKQEEFLQLKKMGWQGIEITRYGGRVKNDDHSSGITEIVLSFDRLAKNDGLVLLDFLHWFSKPISGGIIHFTDFRY